MFGVQWVDGREEAGEPARLGQESDWASGSRPLRLVASVETVWVLDRLALRTRPWQELEAEEAVDGEREWR